MSSDTVRPAGCPSPQADRLGEHLDWWLANLEAKAALGDKSSNTVDNARWAVEAWIKPALGAGGCATSNRGRRRIASRDGKGGEEPVEHRSGAVISRQALADGGATGKVARNVARISEMPATRRPGGPDANLDTGAGGGVTPGGIRRPPRRLIVVGLMLGLGPAS